MKTKLVAVLLIFAALISLSCDKKMQEKEETPATQLDTTGWDDLLAADLSNAIFPEGIWSFEDGILTATEDQNIWTKKIYDNFIVDLDFKTAHGTNSGVIVYCTNTDNWIPNSIEIQIADDFADEWKNADKTWQCGAFFGHKAASKSLVKHPDEWNHYTITAKDSVITIVLNGEKINEMNMSLWTSAKTNPDGSEIPGWLSIPKAELATKGHIGLQGKHAGAPIYFRNLKVKEL